MNTRDERTLHEIRLLGHLGESAEVWFEGFSLETTKDGHTVLRGPVADQAALHGLLTRICDLGLTLTSFRRLSGKAFTPIKKRRGTTMLWISLAALPVLFLTCLFILFGTSSGRPSPLLDDQGRPLATALSEKIHVSINGVEQGMVITSRDVDNPVLLFVHGGPGMPIYWFARQYAAGLEDHFTVVWWDQRGAGLSYAPDAPPETMTAEQFVEDTVAVTRYLLNRFGKERVYLMGHSWGSYIAIRAAAMAPELYHAYVGMGQVVHQIEAEQIAYEYALAEYRRIDDRRMVRRLESAPPSATPPLPREYMRLRDSYMHSIGIGTTREMDSVITGIFLPSLRFPEYTVGEKINLWRGKIRSRSPEYSLWDTMLTSDIRLEVPELSVPAYFFHGRYDYTCAYPLAQEYVHALEAPVKGFYTFEHSAHSPLFEEPEKALSILLQDVRDGATEHADRKVGDGA